MPINPPPWESKLVLFVLALFVLSSFVPRREPEYATQELRQKAIDCAFERVDTDKDGRITEKEIAEAIEKYTSDNAMARFMAGRPSAIISTCATGISFVITRENMAKECLSTVSSIRALNKYLCDYTLM